MALDDDVLAAAVRDHHAAIVRMSSEMQAVPYMRTLSEALGATRSLVPRMTAHVGPRHDDREAESCGA